MRIIPLLMAMLLLTGCAGPGYYWQAVHGHLQILHRRTGVEGLLADPATPAPLRERLLTARAVLAFAESELDLPSEGSYQSYVAVGGPVAWNVVAVPEFSLLPRRWCFVAAGCVSYRGYFERAAADRFAAAMRQRGFDVALAPAAAYSTLGWLHDPLLDTMLDQAPERLAATLIHELAHLRLYVGDTAFSEAYASFVERSGVEAWLEASGRGADLPGWRARQQAAAEFDALVASARADLAALYRSGERAASLRVAKQERLDTLRQDYAELRERRWQGRDHFGAWLGPGLNNAHLALLSAYRSGQCAFEALLRSVHGDFAQFHRRAEAWARRPAAQRAEWLETPCPAVASAGEL